jgi:hypothetical protein
MNTDKRGYFFAFFAVQKEKSPADARSGREIQERNSGEKSAFIRVHQRLSVAQKAFCRGIVEWCRNPNYTLILSSFGPIIQPLPHK